MPRLPSSVPALITGASSGLGEEFARQLGARGHELTLVARRQERMNRLAQEIRKAHGVKVHVMPADLEHAEGRAKVAAHLEAGGPWLLINNAGFGSHHPFARDTAEVSTGMLNVNIVAVTELAHAALKTNLKHRGGGILNVASTAAFQPVPFMSVYAATKAYVLHFTEGIAAENKGRGVRIMALCPGATNTEFGQVAGGELLQQITLALPMSAEKCVRQALKAFDGRQTICITGLHNAAGTVAVRLAPRAVVRGVAATIFKSRAT